MPEEKIPRLLQGADVRKLDLTAQEAFVHSCIDGVLNLEDIADVTVLSPAEVLRSIEHLIELGVAEWVIPKVSSGPPQAELLEDVDIDDALQKRIVETFHRAEKLNHYELLGVAIDAERAEIRKAYFALSKVFHPDAYFGKHLGSFKPKMEYIFRKMTDAYEAIGRPQKREAYDRYLRQSLMASAAEQQMNRVEERARALAKALTQAPMNEEPVPSDERDLERDSQAASSSRPASQVSPGSPEHERMLRKRELLERRLRGRSMRSPSQPSVRTTPKPTAQVGKKAALRDLTRSLRQTAVLTGGIDRAQHHLETARLAEAEGDLAAAATALRMALALDSSRTDLREDYRRVNSRLRIQLLDIHREQARYEEENAMWASASISWAKVAEAAPDDPVAPRRAAKALLSAGGDLRKARDFALRSLEIAPGSLDTRLILARIYIEAGMDNSAAKELDEAAKLDPKHEMVKNLRKQLGG
ncbi:MAG: DnaJ domain-containing protein [Myxococcales bacterium]|jgi:curved DNA-binding protein CbpA